MANLLSPGVKVTTNDLSQVTTAAGDSVGAFAGDFTKGPVNVPTLITSVTELKDTFGGPTKSNYNQWYQVYNFLQYTGEVYVVRAADLNGTPTQSELTFNSNDFVGSTLETKIENTQVVLTQENVVCIEETAEKLAVGNRVKFGTDPKIFKIESVESKTITIPNPDYVELSDLAVQFDKPNFYSDETVSFDYETPGKIEIDTDVADIVSIDLTNKTVSAKAVGVVNLVFSATETGKRTKSIQVTLNITARPKVALSLNNVTSIKLENSSTTQITATTPGALSASIGDASIANVRITDKVIDITGLQAGSTTLTITASAEGLADNSLEVQVEVSEVKPVLTTTGNISVSGTATAPVEFTVEIPDGADLQASIKDDDGSKGSVNVK